MRQDSLTVRTADKMVGYDYYNNIFDINYCVIVFYF